MWTCPTCGRTFRGPGRHAIQCGRRKQVVFICEVCRRRETVEVAWGKRAADVAPPAGWKSGELCGDCEPLPEREEPWVFVCAAGSCEEPAPDLGDRARR